MEQNQYDQMQNMSDRELFDFVTEKDSSQRKWAALYILDTRRAKITSNTAIAAAIAAGLSALVAIVTLITSLIR